MLSVKKRAATEYHCLTAQQYDAFQPSSTPTSRNTNCNDIGGEVHKILSCNWSTVIQTSITTNNTTPFPRWPLENSDIITYYFKRNSQRAKLHVYFS